MSRERSARSFQGITHRKGIEVPPGISYYFYDERNPDNEIGVEVALSGRDYQYPGKQLFGSGIKSLPGSCF
ncbi:MAG: hypothetical protein U5L09_06215 [Bacteroidales bacterium]|nr:hypothetical protein [Bacteroidales bacterium]